MPKTLSRDHLIGLFLCLLILLGSVLIIGQGVRLQKDKAHIVKLGQPNTPAARKIRAAHQAYDVGEYATACSLWYEALDLNPFHPEGIWHDITMCQLEQKHYQKALDAANKALSYPNNQRGDLFRMRGQAYEGLGDFAQAKENYLKDVELEKNNVGVLKDFYYRMSNIAIKEFNYKEALTYYQKRSDLFPPAEYYHFVNRTAWLLMRDEKYQVAETLLLSYEKEIQQKGSAREKIDFYEQLNEVAVFFKKWPTAIHALEELVDLEPENNRYKKSLCYFYSQHYPKIEATAKCAVLLQSTNQDIGTKLGNQVRRWIK